MKTQWTSRIFSAFLIATLAVMALPVTPARAATCTANANGNWNNAAIWTGCGGGIPQTTDDVRIRGQINVTLNVPSVTVNSLTMNSDNNGGASNLSIGANSLTVTNGITFNANNNGTAVQISISTGSLTANTITINGSVNNNSHSQINITGNGTVNVAGAVTLGASSGNNVDNHIAVGTGTFNAGSLSIAGSTGNRVSQVTLSTGTVNVTGHITFSGTAGNARLFYTGAGIVNLGGNLGNGGTFTASTGTIKFNGAGAQSIGSYTYYNLQTSTGGTKTLSGPTTVNNTLTIDSGTTLDVSSRTLTLPGGASSLVNGTLDFSDATGLIQSGNSGTTTLTLGSSGLIRTVDALGLGPVANASLVTQAGGSWVTTSINTNGTIEYYRSATSGQTVTDRDYNNLLISGTTQIKTWTPSALRTVNGNVTIANNAPFTLSGAQTVNVKGDWINNGTFTGGTGTIVFNGSMAQLIGGTNATAFNNLTINNSNGISLNSIDTVVNGILRFTNGKFTTGLNKVIIETTGSIADAGVGKYVFGNLQKNFPTGPRSFSFEVGDAVVYAPAYLSFANVSASGNITASTTGSDHAQISTSSIDPDKDANRFWTLTSGGGISFSTYDATFNFVLGDLDTGADTTDFIVQRLSGTWSSPSVGTLTPTSSQATGLSGFGDFSVGEKAKTTTTVDCIPNPVVVFSGTTCTATVTRTSGSATPSGTVTWSTSETGGFAPAATCVLSGSGSNATCSVTYTPGAVGGGTHLITASYGGDGNFKASSGTATLTVNQATSSVTVTCPAVPQLYTGSAQTPCTASFTTSDGLSGSLTPTYLNNTNVGTATANATYAGDSNHATSGNSSTFDISQATSSVTVTCPAVPQLYTGSAQTPCTASFTTSDGLSGSLTPTYLNNTNVGTATANATYAGDSNHATSSNSSTFDISQATSSVTVTCPAVPQLYTGSAQTPCTASFSTSDGLSGSLTPTYLNNTNVGTATANATYAGDANHATSGNSSTFDISQATSSVTVTCPAVPQLYTGSAQTPCTASFTTSDGLSGSLTPTYSNNTNVGTATANATYAGDSNHATSGNSSTFDISQATSSVTVTCPAVPQLYTGSAQTPCTASFTTSDGLSGSLTPTYLNNTNVGTATANATYAGDSNHATSSNSSTFDISQATSSVTVTCPPSVVYNGSPQTPCTASFSTSDGLSGPLTPTYSNNTNVGTATANATYAGDSNHATSSNSSTFDISQATSSVTVTCPAVPQLYTGSAQTPCTASFSTSDGLSGSLTPTYLNNTNVGTATANATYAGDANHATSSNSSTFDISQATSSVTVTCPAVPQLYTGSAQTPCTASFSTSDGLSGSLTPTYLNNTNVGTATANATYAGDANHATSSNSSTFTISQATSSVTVTCPAVPQPFTGSAQTPCTASFSTSDGLSGSLTPTYLNNTNVGTATANATYAGDANHATSSNSSTFTISQATSSVTVTCPAVPQLYTGSAQTPCTASFSTSDGLSGSLTPTYLNNTNVGTATANATYAGDANHATSSNSSTFDISQATSSVTVTCPAVPQPFTGSAQTPCTAQATGVGMTPVDVTASLVYSNNINLGAATADASWAGDTNHTGNTGSGGFTIGQATSTVTITCPVSVPYTGSPLTPCTAQATGAGMTPVDVTASLIYSNNTNAGAATADASWAGDTNHTGNTGSGGFTIAAAGQTITVVTSAPPTASNSSTFDVEATASSGLPVTITTSGFCTGGDTDGTATITMTSGTGTCSVFYDQAGDANYAAAPQVQEDVTATEGPSFTSADNTTFDFGFAGTFTVTAVGNPTSMTITLGGTIPSGVSLTNTGTGTETLSSTAATPVGVYNLTLTANNGVSPNAVQNFTLTVRNGPIIGANGINSNPDTGDGAVGENESIIDTLGITQLTVEFSQDVYNPPLDTDPDDVTNPANYKLVRSPDGIFATVSCARGVVSPDISISVDSVTYDNGGGSGPFIATLSINGGFPLNVVGFYRLYVCGTTSIVY